VVVPPVLCFPSEVLVAFPHPKIIDIETAVKKMPSRRCMNAIEPCSFKLNKEFVAIAALG